MNAALNGSCLVGMGIFVAFSGPRAHAAEGPLLVVVEAPPALDADAAEIRRAIGVELRAPDDRPDAEERRTTRPRADRRVRSRSNRDVAPNERRHAPLVRDIPTPTDRAARLRAIAWLAGNLARDQVTPIVAEAPAEATPLATIPSNRACPGRPSRPRCQHRRRLQRPLSRATLGTPTAAETVATTGRIAPPENLNGPDQWSITFAYGPTANIDREQDRRIAGYLPGISTFNGGRKGMDFCWAPRSRGPTAISLPRALGCWCSWALRADAAGGRFEATIGAGVELGVRVCTSRDRDALECERLWDHRDASGRDSTWPSCGCWRRGGASAVAVGGRSSFASGRICRPSRSPTGSSRPLWASGTTSSEGAFERSLRRRGAHGRGVDPCRSGPRCSVGCG